MYSLKLTRNFWIKIGAIACLIAYLFGEKTVSALPLSPGDRIEVSIPEDSYFSRAYEVNQNGELEVPYLGNISVVGLEPKEAQKILSQALIDRGYFLPHRLLLSVQVLKWAAIQVTVSGAVFVPGRVLINEPSDPEKTAISLEARQITGENPNNRYLTNAIRAAGGILPTADLKKITLIRGDKKIIVDLWGVFTGEAVTDLALVAGDRIIVPQSDRVQPELVRPSQITPPGIKVFASNLTVPADNNSEAGINNREEGISFPYGARLSQAAIALNCAGGTQLSNVSRRITLMRVDRISGKTTIVDRRIELLMRNSENEAENPFLMPRDGVACYDSTVTNIRDIFKTLGEILSPILLFKQF
ncbi:MAG: polysaccharide biosynthesis/export family protein [Prochloraceae cyanobacterium]